MRNLFTCHMLGGSATNSGLILLPYMLSSVIGATIGGIVTGKFSYRNIMIFSAIVLVIGTYLLSTVSSQITHLILTLFMIIAGFGLGFSFSILSMAPMHNLDACQRGTANSTMAFIRSLGMTVSITIYGVIQRNSFTNQLNNPFAEAGAGQSPKDDMFKDPRALLSPEARMQIPKPALEKITSVLSSSIGQIFVWSLVPALLALVAVLCMSNERLNPNEGKANKETAPAAGH